MKANPFAKRTFQKDTPLTLVKVPDAPVELEKYKPYLVQKPSAPDMPGSSKPRKVIVEKIIEVPSASADD